MQSCWDAKWLLTSCTMLLPSMCGNKTRLFCAIFQIKFGLPCTDTALCRGNLMQAPCSGRQHEARPWRIQKLNCNYKNTKVAGWPSILGSILLQLSSNVFNSFLCGCFACNTAWWQHFSISSQGILKLNKLPFTCVLPCGCPKNLLH